MQLINPVIAANPINWVIVLLMLIIAALSAELIARAAKGSFDCGCNS